MCDVESKCYKKCIISAKYFIVTEFGNIVTYFFQVLENLQGWKCKGKLLSLSPSFADVMGTQCSHGAG